MWIVLGTAMLLATGWLIRVLKPVNGVSRGALEKDWVGTFAALGLTVLVVFGIGLVIQGLMDLFAG